MHITKIELEDIKSHVDSKFEFARGTTSITGENGAGKTTLLEAVAWTLFDLLDYKKDDFVRRGAKRGVARVTFESGLDERPYTVYRDTANGYNVYDPQLKVRIADKKEEVKRFLWQHLGVEAGTDLEALFRRAIGVPQGTFTAIFLESTLERKKAFDKLLKVEEYRQGAEKLRETARFIDAAVASVREKIAHATGELARFDQVKAELKECDLRVEALTRDVGALQKEIEEYSASAAEFDRKEAEFLTKKALADSLENKRSGLEIALRQNESDVERARTASEIVEQVRTTHEEHIATLARLTELDRERIARDKFRAELTDVEAAIQRVLSDQVRAREDLEKAVNTGRLITELEPIAAEQDKLETEIGELREQAAAGKAAAAQIESCESKVNRLRESYAANQQQIRDAEAGVADAASFEELQGRETELIRRLAALQASLERDEQFQRAISDGLCPILSQRCLNLKEGETLEGFVTSQFTELRSEISGLEVEQKEVHVLLKLSREADKKTAMLATLHDRAKEIREEGERLNAEIKRLTEAQSEFAESSAVLAEKEARYRKLDNPKAKLRLLEADARREPELRQKISEIEANLERLESDRRILVEQLDEYKDLDAHWQEHCRKRDDSTEAHRQFIANESAAGLLAKYEAELSAARQNLETLMQELSTAQAEAESAGRDYDRDQHLNAKAALLEAEKREVELRTRLETEKGRQDLLARDIEHLQEVRANMHAELIEKENLEKAAEATSFIRETLKEAAPRVARNYVYHVSLEANQLFREVCGDAEMTLKWTEDYGIVLEEGGYERPFGNLSGGEQMAAALSVRLALLKQLSDIRIAFFDEPTTNMDAERRENLAMQISNIKHFDQLFVISHDDTFEGYTDNVLTVGAEQ